MAIVALLVFLDYGVNYSEWTEIGTIRRLFNMTREDALGSWFGVTVTTLAAASAWLVVVLARHGGLPRSRTVGWAVVALFLTWMAVDDGAAIHERIGTAIDDIREVRAEADPAAGPGFLERFPSYTWQLLLPFFAGLGLFTVGFLWRESRDGRLRAMVVTAMGLFVFAVGLDFFEGLEPDHPWNPYAAVASRWDFEDYTESHFGETSFDTLVHFSKVFEEAIEIVAMTLLWMVVLAHLGRYADGVRIGVRQGRLTV